MKYYVVDAFAEKIFEGNPAGVFILDEWLSENLMQKIAMENNLSETAFAVKNNDKYNLRWFTPGGEVKLCGHATLATAYVLLNYYEQDSNTVTFDTLSGILTVQKTEDLYEMDFPAVPSEKLEMKDQMIEALGLTPLEAYKNQDLLFVLESEEEVKNFKPDLLKLQEFPEGRGVVITAKGDNFDFVSRAFFPKINVNEDPVCGSAHCGLIPYWANKLNKNEVIARQVSNRGGTVYCKLEGSRVKLAGKATLYSIANIFLENYIE